MLIACHISHLKIKDVDFPILTITRSDSLIVSKLTLEAKLQLIDALAMID